ncbi:MAG TPA: flagellar basal body P-ring formation chaperone FlgA [Pyrinomonadaceae bacterium]|nr:flagellar basal body P-ring formation chaperone FlgA [Pyrinomonadaceae bacterium]
MANSERARVIVRDEAVVRGDVLTLADVAEIRSANETELSAISLGYAPQVGVVRELSKQKIALAIAAAGWSTEDYDLSGSAVVRIKRASQIVSPDVIRSAVEKGLVSDVQSTGAVARISRLDLPAAIEVSSGKLEVRVSTAGVKSLFQPFAVGIEFWVDGRIAKRLSATVQVEAYAEVLVAAHELSAKMRLREGDFKFATVRLERNPSLYLTDSTRLRGAALINPLAEGAAITSDVLSAELVVKPGDPVRIVGESKTLTIAVQGEARASGRVGDRIQVKNLQSGLLLQALIIDEGVVSVRF